MISGGIEWSDLNPFNYDYSLSYIDDNLETVFVDAPVAVAKGVASAAVTTYDFFKTVTSSDFWNYYIEDPSRVVDAYKELSTGGKILAAIPFAAGAVLLALSAPITVTIAELGALGAAIFGGAAANAGCTYHYTSAYDEYSATGNEECDELQMTVFNHWQRTCESNGGNVIIDSNISERGRCDLQARCNMGSTTVSEEPDEPQAEGDWCSQQEPDIDSSHYPIISVTGHCSPYMIPARKDAVDSFFRGLVARWLFLDDDATQCMANAGMSSDEIRGFLLNDEVHVETSTEPIVTFSCRSGSMIQVIVGNVMDQLSCAPVESERPNNVYTCTADVSSAVYTCTNVQ